MASSLALKRLVSSNLLTRSLNPVRPLAYARHFSSSSNDRDDVDNDRHRFSPFSDPISSMGLGQMRNMMDRIMGSARNFGSEDGLYLKMAMAGLGNEGLKVPLEPNALFFKEKGLKELQQEEGGRRYSREFSSVPENQAQSAGLRPLSPHLPIYKAQVSSTLSIFNRISAIILTSGFIYAYLLCVKLGFVCFTYESFYKLYYYSEKLFPIGSEIIGVAVAYHVFAGIRHLVADYRGK